MRLMTALCLFFVLAHQAMAQSTAPVEHARELTPNEQTAFEYFAKKYLANFASLEKESVQFTQRVSIISQPLTRYLKDDRLKSMKWLIQHDRLVTPGLALLTESGPSWAHNQRLYLESGSVELNYQIRRKEVVIGRRSTPYDHEEAIRGFNSLKEALAGKFEVQQAELSGGSPAFLIGEHLLVELDTASTNWLPQKLLWTSPDNRTSNTNQYVCKELTLISLPVTTGKPVVTIPAGTIAVFGYGPRQLYSDVNVYPNSMLGLPTRFANASVDWKTPGDVIFLFRYYKGTITATIATLILVFIAIVYLLQRNPRQKEAGRKRSDTLSVE